MAKSVKLFTTSGCHLCEQAEAMFNYLKANDEAVANFDLAMIEIADDEKLVDAYGIRIPVLLLGNNEIGWPFELEELRDWLLHE